MNKQKNWLILQILTKDYFLRKGMDYIVNCLFLINNRRVNVVIIMQKLLGGREESQMNIKKQASKHSLLTFYTRERKITLLFLFFFSYIFHWLWVTCSSKKKKHQEIGGCLQVEEINCCLSQLRIANIVNTIS